MFVQYNSTLVGRYSYMGFDKVTSVGIIDRDEHRSRSVQNKGGGGDEQRVGNAWLMCTTGVLRG